VTNFEVNQFLWAGLTVLRDEAKARGLSRKKLDGLLNRAFDQFHDTGEEIWTALQNVVSLPGWCAVLYSPEQSAFQFQLGDPPFSNVTFCGAAHSYTGGFSSEYETEYEKGAVASEATASQPESESPEFAELRRVRLYYQELAQYDRERQDEELRDLVDD
jgi:hypothetical protein